MSGHIMGTLVTLAFSPVGLGYMPGVTVTSDHELKDC